MPARSDIKTVLLDKNPAVGALAITSHGANYPGVDRAMSGQALLDQMRDQAIDYGTDYRRAQVFLVECDGDRKRVYTPDATFITRALVLATGAMGRPPSYKGEDTYLGQGVSYCATCDGAFYRDSEVAVYGSTGEAMEEAMFLTKFASTVHWITPTDIIGQLERIENGASQNVELNSLFDESLLRDLLSQPNVKHHNKGRL